MNEYTKEMQLAYKKARECEGVIDSCLNIMKTQSKQLTSSIYKLVVSHQNEKIKLRDTLRTCYNRGIVGEEEVLKQMGICGFNCKNINEYFNLYIETGKEMVEKRMGKFRI